MEGCSEQQKLRMQKAHPMKMTVLATWTLRNNVNFKREKKRNLKMKGITLLRKFCRSGA
jgi:hypothetical protein